MKYHDLIRNVNRYNYKNEFMYFKSLERLKEIREDVTKLDDIRHLLGIIKPFLIKWGRMGRVVGRDGLHWRQFGETLRSLEPEFSVLRLKKFRSINYDDNAVVSAVTIIYEKLDPFPYLGSPTTIAKLLHLLNPEIFVMWDIDIRKRYKQRNHRIQSTAEGYVAFLQETQSAIREALHDRCAATGKSVAAVEEEIRTNSANKTLAKIVDEYNYGAVHPF